MNCGERPAGRLAAAGETSDGGVPWTTSLTNWLASRAREFRSASISCVASGEAYRSPTGSRSPSLGSESALKELVVESVRVPTLSVRGFRKPNWILKVGMPTSPCLLPATRLSKQAKMERLGSGHGNGERGRQWTQQCRMHPATSTHAHTHRRTNTKGRRFEHDHVFRRALDALWRCIWAGHGQQPPFPCAPASFIGRQRPIGIAQIERHDNPTR